MRTRVSVCVCVCVFNGKYEMLGICFSVGGVEAIS